MCWVQESTRESFYLNGTFGLRDAGEKKNYVKIGSMNKLQTLISVLIVVH